MEDGMVSTLGAITGIATGTHNHFIVLLSGFVIITVESLSMAVGSYLSNKSQKEVHERLLSEEKTEIKEFPEEEVIELIEMYEKDGWPKDLAAEMARVAGKNPKIMLKEMAYRELHVIPNENETPWKNGVYMGISYVIGGLIPLVPYFLLPLGTAIITSVVITFMGLFSLGVGTTHYTKRHWLKAGFEMLGIAAIAAGAGYVIGKLADVYFFSGKN